MCSEYHLCFVCSGKMYTGNGTNHLTCHAHGLCTYQLPVKKSLVCWPPTGTQVTNQSCLTGLHLSWVLPLGPTSLGNHYLGMGST